MMPRQTDTQRLRHCWCCWQGGRQRGRGSGIIIIANDDIASLNEMLNNRKAKCPCDRRQAGREAEVGKQANRHAHRETEHVFVWVFACNTLTWLSDGVVPVLEQLQQPHWASSSGTFSATFTGTGQAHSWSRSRAGGRDGGGGIRAGSVG